MSNKDIEFIKGKIMNNKKMNIKFFRNSKTKKCNSNDNIIIYNFLGSGGEFESKETINSYQQILENIIQNINKITSKYIKDKCHLFTISKFTYSITDLIGTVFTSIISREYCDVKSDKTTDTFIGSLVKIISNQLQNNYKVILFGHSYGGYIVNKLAEVLAETVAVSYHQGLFIRTLNSIYISKNLKLNPENIIHFYHKNDVAYNRITKYCINSTDDIYKRIIFYGEKQELSSSQKRKISGTNKQWKDHTESFYFIFSFVLCYDLINFFIINKLQINNNRLKNSNNNYNYWKEKDIKKGKIQVVQPKLTQEFLRSRNSKYNGRSTTEIIAGLTNSKSKSNFTNNEIKTTASLTSSKSKSNFTNNEIEQIKVCDLIDENNLEYLDNISCNNIKTLKNIKNTKNKKSYNKSISQFRQIIYSNSINKFIHFSYMYSVNYNLQFFLVINFLKLKNKNNNSIKSLDLNSFKYTAYPIGYKNFYNINMGKYSEFISPTKIKLIKNKNLNKNSG